jgi:protein TonB
MLAYAANRPAVAQRGSSPNAMLAIIALHVAAIAALMSAKMDLPRSFKDTPTVIDFTRPDAPPPPKPIDPEIPQPPIDSTITRPFQPLPLPPVGMPFDPTPAVPSFDDLVGPALDPGPKTLPIPAPALVKIGARLLTPARDLKPPYPSAKLASGEEAVLRLNLTIDERGRVVAVEPLGRADKVFLDAARRHLLTHWRYRPATEDGRAVVSTIAVTLRFQLEA